MIEVTRIASLTGHQNPVYALELSQKPGILFTAGNDKGVVEWSLSKNEFIKVLMPVSSSVYSLHAPESAPVLVVGMRSGQIAIFDFEAQKVVAKLDHHKYPVFGLCSVSGKRELLASSEDGSVSVISLTDYSLLYRFHVADQTVRVIAVSPDEKQVAFGCKDNIIRIYSLDDYTLLRELNGHTHPITSIQYSPDGKSLLSGGRDAKLNVWDLLDYSLKDTVVAHLFSIYDIRFHPQYPYFATCSQDKTIKIWDAESLKLRKIISREKGYPSHSHSINKICWDKQTGNLISISDDKDVNVWKVDFS
ncbi:WD40 repeat domain-containing protein [Pedobacter sp. SYSU D00535]|uniref:WD40 repeat domain-containing protein n=1 Tax=Pedobacter sp. SYSU D00535 TaxID=2810308 RepID=UPI001A95BB57|nr:WD40 repeat domain-containing protein [Pedobacter sp. SYSU D00535]